MNVGIVGLGRMGNSIAYRLLKSSFTVYGYDPYVKKEMIESEINVQNSLKDFIKHIEVLWLMMPSGKPIDDFLDAIDHYIAEKNIIIIDGGNSYFEDSMRRAHYLKSRHNIMYLDCGTSGGLEGKEKGYALMIGGDEKKYQDLTKLWQAIAAPQGYARVGSSGAGHYVKMVHNGIEYAWLQALGEGFSILRDGYFKNLDLATIARVWENGSVLRSWLVELTREVLEKDQHFKTISGVVDEGGTGKWTVQEAERNNISVPLIKESVELRGWSKKTGGNFATKLVALLRNKFGGHTVYKV